MKKYLSILTVFLALLCCAGASDTKVDETNLPKFKGVIGHPVKTKEKTNLLVPNAEINGYKDRYEFGIATEGFPVAVVIPAGHTVLFQRAVMDIPPGEKTGSECLLGTLEFEGKTYPIVFSLPLYKHDEASTVKALHYWFVF